MTSDTKTTVDLGAEMGALLTFFGQLGRLIDFRIEPFEVAIYWNHKRPGSPEWHAFDAQAQTLPEAVAEANAWIRKEIANG